MLTTRVVRGFTLIELMVVIALIGILLALGVPAIANWTADARLRAVAESLTNSVRLAQATAMSRNHIAVVALASTTSGSPSLSSTPAGTGNSWLVAVDPRISGESSVLLQTSTEARQHGVSISGPSMVCFNSFGQPTATLTTSLLSASSCASPSTDDSPTVLPKNGSNNYYYTVTRTNAKRTFYVLVYAGGRVRMCDALKAVSTSNPDGCPTS